MSMIKGKEVYERGLLKRFVKDVCKEVCERGLCKSDKTRRTESK